MTTSQEFLVQAAQNLSKAVTEAGTAPNDFGKNLLELLEVSTKINQFDEMASTANTETTSAEAQQWREISLMTMQHARTHLVEQQQRLIEGLRGLSESGASLYKAPNALPSPTAVKPPAGLPQEAKSNQMAVQPPPGLAAPPGLSMPLKPSKVTNRKPLPPPGLKPPPGLASAGTAQVTPPPGLSTPVKSKLSAAAHPWRINKKVEDKPTNFFEARFCKENTQTASNGMINLDAYDSD